jgi:hypothetical protein
MNSQLPPGLALIAMSEIAVGSLGIVFSLALFLLNVSGCSAVIALLYTPLDLVRVCLYSPETVGLEAGNVRVARLLAWFDPLLLSCQVVPVLLRSGPHPLASCHHLSSPTQNQESVSLEQIRPVWLLSAQRNPELEKKTHRKEAGRI